MRSSNPFLQQSNNQGHAFADDQVGRFTTKGALSKTLLGIFTMIVLIILFNATNLVSVFAQVYGIIAIGLIIAMIWMGIKVRTNIKLARTFFWVYVVCESALLSVVLALVNSYYPGIGTLAGIITIMIVFAMAILYRLAPGLIGKLQPIVFIGVIFVFIIYFINIFVLLFTGNNLPLLYSMGFSIILLILSMFSVATDFRVVDIFEKQGLPKEYEYLGALGLLTSIVWLYYNVLRILIISRER